MHFNRKLIALLLCVILLLTGCGTAANNTQNNSSSAAPFPDGVYYAKFNTDSTMFHVNSTKDGWGVLTIKDGQMTIHVSLASSSILNPYVGLAEEAQKDTEHWLNATKDPITYPDGLTEDVHGFDIPVPVINEEFDCAPVGKKGTWYDHKVSVTDVCTELPKEIDSAEVTLTGGTGKVTVNSPCKIEKDDQGQYWATIVLSSKNYEFMQIGETKYDRIEGEEYSTFKIPVVLDEDMTVSGQTVAMSTPHLVEYTMRFSTSTAAEK